MVAIAAYERRDLAQLIDLLAVFIRHTLDGIGVDQIDFEIVGLGDGEEGGGAWVALS